MKQNLILSADSKDFKINGEAALRLSSADFTKAVVQTIDELSTVHGHRTNYIVRGVAWAMKGELNKRGRQADNAVTASVAYAITTKDAEKLSKLSDVVEKVSLWIEAMFIQYEAHAQDLSTLGDYAVEFHPFQRRIEATFQLNNEIDDGAEFDQFEYDYADDDEDDEAAAWIEEHGLATQMKQSELRTPKVNVAQAMDSEPKAVFEDVSRTEWVEDRVHRSPAEWVENAQYGAWGGIKALVSKATQHVHYPLVLETVGGMPEKPLAFATKCMRKQVDMTNRVERLESQKQYVLDRIYKMDNTADEAPIAAVSNAVRDDEVDEIDTSIRDAVKVLNFLDEYTSQFNNWLELVNLDTPIRRYSTYVAFDPVEMIMNQMVKKAGFEGRRLTARDNARLEADALTMLGNPTTIESFELEDAGNLRLWGIHFTEGTFDELRDKAKDVSKIRTIQYRQAELEARANKLARVQKGSAMRNKKPTSPLELEDITNQFLF